LTPPAEPAPTRLPASGLAALVAVVVLWGAAYPMMKIAALEIPLFAFRSLSALVPGVILLIMARLGRHSLGVVRESRLPLVIAAICTVSVTHLLTTLSTLYMASGQTSIMLYTMPVWAFIIGVPVLGERPTWGHWAGVGLGLCGIVLLWFATAGDGGVSLGVLIGVIAAISWAAGTVAAKKAIGRVVPIVFTGWVFVIGSLPLGLIGLGIGELNQFRPVSDAAIWSAVFVAMGTNFIGFLAFYHIVRMVPATVASLSVLAVPAVAFSAGFVLLDERMTVTDGIAFSLIAAALATVLPKPSRKKT
jgi:drug/metabolite transporter (DMT)-like permease